MLVSGIRMDYLRSVRRLWDSSSAKNHFRQVASPSLSVVQVEQHHIVYFSLPTVRATKFDKIDVYILGFPKLTKTSYTIHRVVSAK